MNDRHGHLEVWYDSIWLLEQNEYYEPNEYVIRVYGK